MPGTSVNLGTGTSITFGTSGFTSELLSVNWTGISTAVVDTTPLAVTPAPAGQIGNRRYKAAFAVDPGTLECEFHFNPDVKPPIGEPAELITITFPMVSGDLTAAQWRGQGQMLSYDISGIELDTKMVARVNIKLTGSIEIIAAT
jgi:hypothetical protein